MHLGVFVWNVFDLDVGKDKLLSDGIIDGLLELLQTTRIKEISEAVLDFFTDLSEEGIFLVAFMQHKL